MRREQGIISKKYVDPDVDLLQGRGTVHAWIIFRLAEMYLNYAEAMNEHTALLMTIITE